MVHRSASTPELSNGRNLLAPIRSPSLARGAPALWRASQGLPRSQLPFPAPPQQQNSEDADLDFLSLRGSLGSSSNEVLARQALQLPTTPQTSSISHTRSSASFGNLDSGVALAGSFNISSERNIAASRRASAPSVPATPLGGVRGASSSSTSVPSSLPRYDAEQALRLPDLRHVGGRRLRQAQEARSASSGGTPSEATLPLPESAIRGGPRSLVGGSNASRALANQARGHSNLAQSEQVDVPDVGPETREELHQLANFLNLQSSSGDSSSDTDVGSLPDLTRTFGMSPLIPSSGEGSQNHNRDASARVPQRLINEAVFDKLCQEGESMSNGCECSICYMPVKEDAVALPCQKERGCNSIFHRDCIRPWFERNPSCPLCRTEVPDVVQPLSRQALAGFPGTATGPLFLLWMAALAEDLQSLQAAAIAAAVPSHADDLRRIRRAFSNVGSANHPRGALNSLQGRVVPAHVLLDAMRNEGEDSAPSHRPPSVASPNRGGGRGTGVTRPTAPRVSSLPRRQEFQESARGTEVALL